MLAARLGWRADSEPRDAGIRVVELRGRQQYSRRLLRRYSSWPLLHCLLCRASQCTLVSHRLPELRLQRSTSLTKKMTLTTTLTRTKVPQQQLHLQRLRQRSR
jgi:hypothetical protein